MSLGPDPDGEDPGLPPELRYLKRLVSGLTWIMILGFVVLIAALVIRLNADPVPLPDRITLPDGVSAHAFTQGEDWFAVVTSQDEILIYDRASGALRQTIKVDLTAPQD
ncbi:DUF6476 family protein [Alexandriicola marinus]|uniref:DUF6476 family protein n=1 Tax=Alexandriicola marinus TaxID=2081710 RepID=UPI000FD6C4BB|nr:DUF6476 family protein [Alexandriicola marinus]